jgi:alpha-acetolactate decarboxylase
MGRLEATISAGLWRALVDHAEKTREPLSHIVSKALAEYLQVSHHTLYQVSTATALVEGVYQGAVRVGTLRDHGDLGLGTFENLDGEMVVIDGRFFQVRSDGSVRECADDMLSPFAVVTRFVPDDAVTLRQCPDGFWTPDYAQTLNVPGYHLHFLSADRNRGGHLLQCRGSDLRLQIQREGDYHIALPETEDFLKADLHRDPAADLARAEGEKP